MTSSASRSLDPVRLRDPGLAFALLLSASCLVAALPWLHAYSSTGAHVMLLLGAVLPVALALVGSRLPAVGAPLAFVGSGLALMVVAFAASGFSTGALGSALLHGPGHLLTETLPLAGAVSVVPALVAVWLPGAVAGELAFRGPPASQLSGASLSLPVLSFVAALAVTAPAPGRDWLPAPALLLAIASASVARQELVSRSLPSVVHDLAAETPTGRSYRPIGLVVLLAAAVGLGIPALPGVAVQRGSVYERPPTSSSVLTDPVASFGALRDQAVGRLAPLLHVVTRGRTDGYLTAAVLDNFDGSVWTFASTFEPSGGRVPTPAGFVAPEVGNRNASSRITILRRLPLPTLPVFERPSRIDGIPVAIDAEHGMAVADEPVRLPAPYTVASVAPVLTLAEVPAVDGISVPTTGERADDVQLPADTSDAIATSVRFAATITGSRPAPTVAFLQQAMAALQRSDTRIVPRSGSATAGALGGTSLSQVINAVTVTRSATPEQFATFLALVARYLGVPVRVATGFRVEPDTRSAGLPAGSYNVTARQAWTWVEVPVSGMGWLVADPTPLRTSAVGSPPPEEVQATPTTLPAPRANAVPRNQAAGGHAVAKPVHVGTPRNSGVAGWVPAVLIAGIIMLAAAGVLGIPALLRRRRTRKRFSTDPALLAGGAWLELLDNLSRSGMDLNNAWTSTEVATEAGRHFGAGVPERVHAVGRVADRAVCSLSDPPDFESAMTAWEAQRQLAQEIQRGLDRRQRALIRISVGAHRRGARW